MFNKINKYKFWIAGGLILALGMFFLAGMFRFIGFGIKKEPRGTLFQIAKQYYLNGDYKKAANSYEKVLALEPTNTNAMLDLAIICDDYLNMDDRAIELYRRYADLSPNSKKKALVETWIKDSANDSFGIKINSEPDKIKQLEKEKEVFKNENESLKEQVQTLSGKLYTIQSDNEKELKKQQQENEQLMGELTSSKLRTAKLIKSLSASENSKKSLLTELENALKKNKELKLKEKIKIIKENAK